MVTRPEVSFLMANRNGARHLEAAVESVLNQELRSLELIIVDDQSQDDSLRLLDRLVRRDVRIRVHSLERPSGPGAARNRAFDLAQGQWAAVIDSDDLMHPTRVGRLIADATNDGADIALDDLLVFQDDRSARPARFLTGRRRRRPTWLTAEDFLLETRLFQSGPNLGYLKPVIRMDTWRRAAVRYDPALSIGEDHDLLLRLLAAGARARIYPSIGYFYRKHPASTSHRMSSASLAEIARAQQSFAEAIASPPPRMARALRGRMASIEIAAAFTSAVSELKQGRLLSAMHATLGRPGSLWLFRFPLAGLARRLVGRFRRIRPAPSEGDLWFISRQRLAGRTNGSSTYLLQLADAARAAGFLPRLLQPTPRIMGRWPVMRLSRDMRVFDRIAIRNVVRFGDWVISPDPRVWSAAAREALARLLGKVGAPTAWLGARPAPYAPALPWDQRDRLFVAQQVGQRASMLVADYAWQTEAFSFALSPDARTAVVMHDLFHQRALSFADTQSEDSVANLSASEEARLLGRAETIVAIQGDEAEAVRALLPGRRIVLAPMAVEAWPEPQPGNDREVLFVGSNTAPNVAAVRWLLDEIWPHVLAGEPGASLSIAGNVIRAGGCSGPGVKPLGFVADLRPLYARAGIVVSPLISGSGLKVKLVEALAHGKACVVTPITRQGVERETDGAVVCAETAEIFAWSILTLMRDRMARAQLGKRALSAARTSFGPESALTAWTSWLAEQPGPATGGQRDPLAIVNRRSAPAPLAHSQPVSKLSWS